MLQCYYKLLRQTCLLILNCREYWAWTHCASCRFNTAWFIYKFLLMRKHLSNLSCRSCRKHVVHAGNMCALCLRLNVLQVSLGKFHLEDGSIPQFLPFINIAVNHLCISIDFVLNKTLTKNMKYLYLPACYAIINLNYWNIYFKISGVLKANIFVE